jgi:uncharacterized membrane protein YwaF
VNATIASLVIGVRHATSYITVVQPPTSSSKSGSQGILDMLLSFPYVLIIVAAVAVVVLLVFILIRRRGRGGGAGESDEESLMVLPRQPWRGLP